MKAVMKSVSPRICEKVANGDCTILVSKTAPKCGLPFNGFVNQYIHGYPAILGDNDCLSFNDMKAYLGNKKGYDWHISDLKIYDKPKELSEFKVLCNVKTDCHNCPYYNYNKMNCDGRVITRAPQSWQYVEDLKNE